jgi:hypothetical protein
VLPRTLLFSDPNYQVSWSWSARPEAGTPSPHQLITPAPASAVYLLGLASNFFLQSWLQK